MMHEHIFSDTTYTHCTGFYEEGLHKTQYATCDMLTKARNKSNGSEIRQQYNNHHSTETFEY